MKEIKSRKKQLNLNYQQQEVDSEVSKKLENLQDQIFAKGFSEEEMSEILKSQREIIERDQELESVLTSIVELQGLFKEIHEAVIEQGTMLDRIDNNIDNAQTNILESVGHLEVTFLFLFFKYLVIKRVQKNIKKNQLGQCVSL